MSGIIKFIAGYVLFACLFAFSFSGMISSSFAEEAKKAEETKSEIKNEGGKRQDVKEPEVTKKDVKKTEVKSTKVEHTEAINTEEKGAVVKGKAVKSEAESSKVSLHKKDEKAKQEKPAPKIDTEKDQSQFVQAEASITTVLSRLIIAFPKCGKDFSSTMKTFLDVSPQSAGFVLDALKVDENSLLPSAVKDCHNKSIGRALARVVKDLTESDIRMASHLMGLIIKSENPTLQTAFLSMTGSMTASTKRKSR